MADDISQVPEMSQACVIPYRVNEAGELLVCLITSLKKKRWIFPKGIVEPGETVAEAGLKEAWEEAGLRGDVGPVVDRYRRQKWGKKFDVHVMLMKVSETRDEWPEYKERQRIWSTVAEAELQLGRAVHRKLLRHVTSIAPQNLAEA